MDIERIQKINNLALDLMRQGLATDKDDAISQAEKIFRHGSEDYDALATKDMHSNSLQVKQGFGESTTTESSENSGQNSSGEVSKEKCGMSQDKIESILEQNTKYVVTKLKEFQDKVEKLESEMSSLKMEVNRCRSSMSSMQQRPSQQPVQQTSQQQNQQQQQPAQQNSNGNHPRSGGYEENDVSIEKFFYTGNK